MRFKVAAPINNLTAGDVFFSVPKDEYLDKRMKEFCKGNKFVAKVLKC